MPPPAVAEMKQATVTAGSQRLLAEQTHDVARDWRRLTRERAFEVLGTR
ncbi:MAG: hypothetical protein ABIQ16_25455 [Polyangiaceae bacterium]